MSLIRAKRYLARKQKRKYQPRHVEQRIWMESQTPQYYGMQTQFCSSNYKKIRKKYTYESRHKHAETRQRDSSGRFLKKNQIHIQIDNMN